MKFIFVSVFFFSAGVGASFDSNGQASILAAHNDLRSQIAEGKYTAKGTKKPSATNMLKLNGWSSNVFTGNLANTGIAYATQAVWAETNKVGCGVASCSDNGQKITTVVCQYSTAGNILDANIYETGPTCSACPSGTKCESASGLCA